MPLGLQQLAPPANEPVTLQEAKDWLRLEIPDDDAVVRSLIAAARKYVENRTGMQLCTATWEFTADRFPRYSQLGGLQYASEILWSQRVPQTELSGRYWPDRASFRVPRPPLQSVTIITYIDGSTGNLLVLDPGQYLVDNTTRPGRICPKPGSIWPIVIQQLASVSVTYTAGFGGPGDVPDTLKLAMKMLIASWYENREALASNAPMPVPMGFEALLASEWDGEYF